MEAEKVPVSQTSSVDAVLTELAGQPPRQRYNQLLLKLFELMKSMPVPEQRPIFERLAILADERTEKVRCNRGAFD